MSATLPTDVQMQFLRPRQLEAALRKFPVVYVPLGCIEWHGQHLPLGTDALKSHGILTRCASESGGVVFPPVYFPHAWYVAGTADFRADEEPWKLPMMTSLFSRIKLLGARVIIGVSGHNIPQQITLINRALEPATADGTIAGIGLWEFSLAAGDECASDHAAKWETSDMMHLYPGCVDLTQLGTGPLAPDMNPPDGIGGLDPRLHASARVGERKSHLAAESIGRKARELLASLPPEHRAFRLPAVSPEHWWMV
ncbi:MAG: creatininase family protein [Planctomycetes bacterium]|nr:creatininase family protein [Planctomycetota bacterium]